MKSIPSIIHQFMLPQTILLRMEQEQEQNKKLNNQTKIKFFSIQWNRTRQKSKINLFSIHYYSFHKVKQTKPNPKKLAPFSSLYPSIHPSIGNKVKVSKKVTTTIHNLTSI